MSKEEVGRYMSLARQLFGWARQERRRAFEVRASDGMLAVVKFAQGGAYRLSAKLLADELRSSCFR